MRKKVSPKNKKERANRLKTLRKISRLSRPEITKNYGISYANFQNWENARFNGLSEEGAQRMIDACKMVGVEATLAWLMYGVEPGPVVTEKFYIKDNPVLALTAIANLSESDDMINIARELILFKQNYQGKVLALFVEDDGMEPSYLIGECVAGKALRGEDILQLVNQDCIVEVNGKLWLRHLRVGSETQRFDLICNNPRTTKSTIKNAQVTCAAPILWVRRRAVV